VDNTFNFSEALPAHQRETWSKILQPMGTFVEFSKNEVEKSIPERFESIVRLNPCRTAVKTDNRIVTYSELNAMADRVAHAILAQRGDKPQAVGLLVEKGPALFASMLGVLKVGKFFTLIDPTFPKARITAILQDTGAELLIADWNNARLAEEVESSACHVIEFESIHCGASAKVPPLQISPDTLAYVIYTSGSTGKPKGVIQTHRNLLHNIRLRAKITPVYLDDRIAQLPSGTSNAITNTFFALLNGAELLPFDVQKNGVSRLATWLTARRCSGLCARV
jgi:non-ribosomal peptide synthetase component F